MSKSERQPPRRLGLFDATSIGVGAIVGGGILALAGTALAATGPGAWLAFLLNGIIAVVTCLSFSELSTAFPQSGGTYLFAKRALSVGAAFSIGWVVWFASIVAAALFQGVTVPSAGLITGAWLVAGFFCYLWLFGRRARVYDAASESADPDLLELRGRSPLVLVPIANPANAGTMALLAACITPPRVGRVLLLNIARFPTDDRDLDDDLATTADVLRQSMYAAISERIRVEGMATVSADPWTEINRVARAHRCASVLLGMTNLADAAVRSRIEGLASRLPGNVVIFRAPSMWQPRAVRTVLVPIGGRVVHNALRARLLNGLHRRVDGELVVRYLLVLPGSTTEQERLRTKRLWSRLVTDETSALSQVEVVLNDEVASAILDAALETDLIVLGLNKPDRRRRVFGPLTVQVIQEVRSAVMAIGQRE